MTTQALEALRDEILRRAEIPAARINPAPHELVATRAELCEWADSLTAALADLTVDEEMARRVHSAYFDDPRPSPVEVAYMKAALTAALNQLRQEPIASAGGSCYRLAEQLVVVAQPAPQGAVATVCLVGDRYAHDNFIEVTVQLQKAPGVDLPIGTKLYTHPSPTITEAHILGAVARGWCSPDNSHKEMDATLATAIAKEVAALLRDGSAGEET